LKLTHVAPVLLFISLVLSTAGFCIAQNTPQPDIADAGQSGQQRSTPPADPSQGQSPGKDKDKDKDGDAAKDPANAKSATSATSKDRLFYALPNFLTLENAGQAPPLTAGQKFKVVARGSFDPIQIVWYGALSGISQAENSEPGFRQGAEGYGKRYGAYAADGTIENFFVGAILPSVLRQDPRYFQSGRGSFFQRTGYAVSRIVVTRGDSGHQEFNFSEVFGSAIASSISTFSYHPRRTLIGMNSDGSLRYTESDRTLANTASVWGSQVGYDTITLVIKEFWPDIRRKMKKQPH